MSIASPALYEDDDVTPLAELAFPPPVAGLTGDPWFFRIWNGKGDAAAEDAWGGELHLSERAIGTSLWGTGYLVDTRAVQFRVVEWLGTATGPTVPTAWTAAGTGLPYRLPATLPGNGGARIESQAAPTAPDYDTRELRLRFRYNEARTPLVEGWHEGGVRGVLFGLGNRESTFLVSGGIVTAQGSPSTSVDISETAGVVEGLPVLALADAFLIDDTASNGAVPAGGAHWKALYLGASGIEAVAGVLSESSPAGIELRPTAPAGLLAYVHKAEGAVVEAEDIYQDERLLGRFALEVSGLEATLHPGVAFVGDNRLTFNRTRIFNLPESEAEVRIFLTTAGLVFVSTDGTAPEPRALLLYSMETDGVGVVSGSLVDWRADGSPRAREIRLSLPGVLVVDQAAAATLRHGLLIDPKLGVSLSLEDKGGGTAGATVVDLEKATSPTTWESLFAGDTTRRPEIPEEEIGSASAVPDVLVLSPGDIIRARIHSLPTGGAAPENGELLIQGEIP